MADHTLFTIVVESKSNNGRSARTDILFGDGDSTALKTSTVTVVYTRVNLHQSLKAIVLGYTSISTYFACQGMCFQKVVIEVMWL